VENVDDYDIEDEIKSMTSAGESCIKEKISMTRQEYSILKEDMKYDECG
jgi:hypothetical protein